MWFILLVLVCVFWFGNYTIQTSYYHFFTNKKFKNGNSFRVLHLSDFHNNGHFLHKIKNKVIEANPDVIVITGDVVAKRKYDETMKLFDWLNHMNYQVYFSTGNHETYMNEDEFSIFKKVMRNTGVVLCDKKVLDCETKNDVERICIYGISGLEQVKRKISFEINELQPSSFNIVLMHQPECIELQEICKNPNIDIIFSGHAHGGQWINPFTKTGTYAPNQGLFPKYTFGEYKVKNIRMYLSRGIGTLIPYIPRIFNRPHIICVDIHSKC